MSLAFKGGSLDVANKIAVAEAIDSDPLDSYHDEAKAQIAIDDAIARGYATSNSRMSSVLRQITQSSANLPIVIETPGGIGPDGMMCTPDNPYGLTNAQLAVVNNYARDGFRTNPLLYQSMTPAMQNQTSALIEKFAFGPQLIARSDGVVREDPATSYLRSIGAFAPNAGTIEAQVGPAVQPFVLATIILGGQLVLAAQGAYQTGQGYAQIQNGEIAYGAFNVLGGLLTATGGASSYAGEAKAVANWLGSGSTEFNGIKIGELRFGAPVRMYAVEPGATVNLTYTPLAGEGPEFMRQLAGQEKGLNNLTAGEIRANIEAFNANGRPSSASQAVAEYRRESPVRDDPFVQAYLEGTTAPTAPRFAALHEPDMVIGGYANGVTGYGDLRVNSSIGAQNRNMQSIIYNAVKQVPPDTYIRFNFEVKK